MLKIWIYILPSFQNITQIMKKNSFNDSKRKWIALPYSKKTTLLKRITSKHDSHLFIWVFFIHLEQKTNFGPSKKVCENKIFYGVVIPSEDTKILEFNQYRKSAPSITYAAVENLWLKE